MTRAVVVGSGPNGLAAALTLAVAGIEVTVLESAATPGGGTRSVEATHPGVLHDECAGFHPLAVDTAFSRSVDLASAGLQWAWPEIQYAHPLDGGRGGSVVQSVDVTADGLGSDASRYRRVFGPLDQRFDKIATEFLQPMLHVPRHPVALAGFGSLSVMPATLMSRNFGTDEGKAVWAGLAAHAFRPFGSPFSSAIGVALGTAAHHYGWPVAIGGSRAITDAMITLLGKHGGRVLTGERVTSLDAVRREHGAELALLDTSPRTAVEIIGDRLPARVRRAYERYQHGTSAFQVAFAVHEGVPWAHEPTRRAGTVHVGGTFSEIAAAERDTWRGRMPERPFVLVGQQSLADPSRARDGVHPIDAYAHVPAGFDGDATEAIIDQIERFAPGFRDRIVAMAVRSSTQIADTNANFVGGDILTGANTARQLVFRPRVALNPYSTGVDGVYLCSAATPPGAGAHGMAGFLAARSAMESI